MDGMPSNKRTFFYGWVVVAAAFVVLLITAGIRNTSTVILKPLEAEFGWSRGEISFSFMLSLIAFGFGGPLGGWLMNKLGPRRLTLASMAILVVGILPMLYLKSIWQLHVFWGVLVGIGTGAVSGTLAAAVSLRWFVRHQGLVLGALGAAGAAGQLIFLPLLIDMAQTSGWRSVMVLLAWAVAVTLAIALLLMRDRPEVMGQTALGAEAGPAGPAVPVHKTPLREAVKTKDFWLLAASFFVCGYTTNGLIGSHLLPHAIEHGFAPAQISWALGLMGAMNIVGTMASGWLSERFDNRKLLAIYYTFRGLSLAVLPWVLRIDEMFVFAIVYGLDWIATVPPTVKLTARRFGKDSVGVLYGWIFCSHMIGAGLAAWLGGVVRDALGDYTLMFLSAAVMGLIAAALSMGIRKQVPTPVDTPAS
jgi:MFS family permease